MSEDLPSALIPAHPPAWSVPESPRSEIVPDSVNARASESQADDGLSRCRLLELPAELREHIWNLVVSEWMPIDRNDSSDPDAPATLCRKPVRIDRFNHTPPAAITAVSSRTRTEALQMYYHLNTFEFWGPRFRRKTWVRSSLVDWLSFLGPQKRSWLRSIVLLCKKTDEFEPDAERILAVEGLHVPEKIICYKLPLSEYEQRFEQLGLPRHFGRKQPRRLAAPR